MSENVTHGDEVAQIVTDRESEDGRTGQPGEISLYNTAAIRGEHGIWNEDSLPVTEWEAAEHRVVVPASLQASLTLPVPAVLRWDDEKYRLVVNQRHRDLPVILNLTHYLSTWRYHGEEIGEHAGNQRILLQDDYDRWYAVSIGPLQGSHNVITVIGGSDRRYLDNRKRGMKGIFERRK